MPNQNKVNNVIKTMTQQFDTFAKKIIENNYNTSGVWFDSNQCSFYVRNMARGILSNKLVFCLSSININPSYQNCGILSEFIKYVSNNPYCFKEFEIENVQSEQLFISLTKKGFAPLDNRQNIEFPITVFKYIN